MLVSDQGLLLAEISSEHLEKDAHRYSLLCGTLLRGPLPGRSQAGSCPHSVASTRPSPSLLSPVLQTPSTTHMESCYMELQAGPGYVQKGQPPFHAFAVT